MITIDTTVQVLLAAIALSLVAIAFILFSLLRTLKSTSDPVGRLRERTRGNWEFLSDKSAFYDFVVSEAAIHRSLHEIEEQDIEGYIDRLEKDGTDKKKVGILKGIAQWFKSHRGAIGEKLFDKLNDVAKSFIPGTSKEK